MVGKKKLNKVITKHNAKRIKLMGIVDRKTNCNFQELVIQFTDGTSCKFRSWDGEEYQSGIEEV
jgi:hypothetical protein